MWLYIKQLVRVLGISGRTLVEDLGLGFELCSDEARNDGCMLGY